MQCSISVARRKSQVGVGGAAVPTSSRVATTLHYSILPQDVEHEQVERMRITRVAMYQTVSHGVAQFGGYSAALLWPMSTPAASVATRQALEFAARLHLCERHTPASIITTTTRIEHAEPHGMVGLVAIVAES